ncbi:MAG: serine/threonine protein kinase [Alphaproteobacteria bacterium]|nr:serine/threonine protein kinase [Alphaproteobacteria bacterium]
MAFPDPGLASSSEKRQFSIKSCLGRGGFGEVYRASMTNATGLENEVAVKLLHHDLDRDSQAVQRLRDEGRMLGALVHPAILRIYDFVVLDARVGLVMEYVEGQDLAKCIRGDDPMPPRAIAAVVGRVADALRAAWDTPAPGTDEPLHLIHRDIKPQNIRIGTQGDVKLLDFGVARAANVGREAQTGTGHMVGSYLYMAPECLLENAFGRESDIFALGVTMFESLSHRRLFRDLSLRELYVMVLQEEEYTRFMEEAFDEVDAPEPLVSLMRRMLERDPSDRPSAAEVSAICDDLVDSLDGPTLRRWCKNRSWPPPNEVAGILDGRTITEATMAAGLMPDLGLPMPATRSRRVDWSLVFGTVGTIGMLAALAVAGIALVIAVVAIVSGNGAGPSRPVDTRTYTPPMSDIPRYSGVLEPTRTERTQGGRTVTSSVSVAAPAPAPTTTWALLNLDTDFDIRLLRNGRTYEHLDRVSPGDYALQVDWGLGYSTITTVQVRSDTKNVTVTCNRFKRTCDVQ